MKRNISLCAVDIVLVLAGIGAAETPNRATILYDSFGKNPALTSFTAARIPVVHGT